MKFLLVINFIIAIHFNLSNCFSPRIAYGDLAEPGQFPYHVLFKIDDDYGYNWCGGVLISDKYILTTAECLEVGKPSKAYLGITNITEGELPSNAIRLSINPENDFIFSPNDENGTLGIVKIEEPIKFSNFIKPITLPSSTLSQNELEGKQAILTGFGVPLTRHADTSKFLRYIEIPIISQNTCKQSYNFFDNNYLCASSTDEKSFCFGDQGGPLVIQNFVDENILIGIAYTQGPYCGSSKWPGVYIRITSSLDWIHQVTGIERNENAA